MREEERQSEDALAPPSSRELALHEVVGWLLGAAFAVHDPKSVDEIPRLLAEHRHAELDLLRTTLCKYIGQDVSGYADKMREQAPQEERVSYRDLLQGLQAYCKIDWKGSTDDQWWTPNTSSTRLSNAFLSRVMNVVEHRSLWHADRLTAKQSGGAGRSTSTKSKDRLKWSSKLTCPEGIDTSSQHARRVEPVGTPPVKRTRPPKTSKDRCRSTDPNGGALPFPGKHLAQQLPRGQKTILDFAVPKKAAEPANDPGAVTTSEAALEPDPADRGALSPEVCSNAAPAGDGNDPSVEDEEWPEGNGSCEGCGRITYSCEAWSKACVILCDRCRKARSPMWWALASEAFRAHSAIGPAGMGGA